MSTLNVRDSHAVEHHVARIFSLPSVQARAEAVGRLFVEELDFPAVDRRISLANAPAAVTLPADAHHVASLDNTHVVYVALDLPDSDRVRKAEASAADKLISDQLGDELLLVFTNTSCSQLHLIFPSFEGKRRILRRMVVERDLPRRTAIQQIANIYQKKQQTRSIHMALESAFDVEAVTKRFFTEYKRVFDAALDKVSGFGFSHEEKDTKRLYVQTLFNRLMFVYFLSRKGWLTFNGNKDYLNALWNDYRSQDEESSFYNSRLDLLFFAGLNNPQSQDLNYNNEIVRSLIGVVPFLNGGLFEKSDLDKRDGITVPDAAVKPILTDLFDRFNFTVMESTPFDIEVAVDPEMLGKVFEKLVTGRHESGSYYTPRPVVAFMCREALKGYLAGHNTGLSSEAVAAFVDDHHTSGVSITAALRLAAALEEVTVVDPACGSGAYLLGMMQELVELQTALFSDQLLADPRSLYELKLQIIQRNLYGADIDPFATNIAMLRLWLSLAIEYEGERPEPLPNLDFKIVCGDSLLGPDPDPTNLGDLFKNKAHEVAEQISVLKADHMNAIGAHKDRLKEEVETVQNELRRVLVAIPAPVGTVDWRVEFAEVFDGRGGFDIVVANPPYVRQELLTSLKTDLASLYPGVYDGRADILVYFYTRAGQLLHTGASLAFITSNSFTKRKYGKNLRSLLANQLTINTLIDFGEVKVFDATVEAYILIGRKTLPPPGSIVRGHNLYPLLTRKIGRSGNVEKAREEMGRLSEHLAAELSVFPQTRLNSWEWRIEDENINRLFERLTIQGTPLGEFANGRIYMGVKTGLNEAFVIDQFRRDELVAEDPRNAEIIRPWLRGRDIKTWRAEWAGLHIIYANRGVEIERYPAIQEHLALFRNRLENRATAHLHPWYELQQPQEGIHQYFIRPKIIWPVIARSVRFSYDISGSYINDRCHIMPSGMMWMLTVINSELFEFLLCQITNSLRGGFMQLFFHCTTRLPVVTPDATLQRRLESIAHAGVNGEPVDDDELNDMVYWLYGLSEKEVALVKGWFERRSLTTG